MYVKSVLPGRRQGDELEHAVVGGGLFPADAKSRMAY